MPWAGLLLPPAFGRICRGSEAVCHWGRIRSKGPAYSHTTVCRMQQGSAGELGAATLSGTGGGGSTKAGASQAYGGLGRVGICCRHGSKMPAGADLTCLHLALLSYSCEAAASANFSSTAAASLSLHALPRASKSVCFSQLYAERAAGSTEGCLKSMFETGHSSGKTHLLLHLTFSFVTTEGTNLGGLTLVLRLILLVYLSIPEALQLVFKFLEMIL